MLNLNNTLAERITYYLLVIKHIVLQLLLSHLSIHNDLA